MKQVVPLARAIVLTLLFITSTSRAFSQSIFSETGKWEAGIGLGPMFFLGDLGGSAGIGKTFVKDVDLPLTKLSKGLFINYNPAEWLGVRFALNHSVVQGDDAQAPNKGGDEVYRLNRNLSFKSHIFEAYVAAEIYPSVFFEKYDGLAGKLRPYGIIGVGMFKFNPKTRDDNGEWVELQPLRTEGQGMAEYPDRKPYKLVQAEVPMGLGFKYFVKENMYVGLEVLHRKLFTDYVDDVSTSYIDPIYFDTYLSPSQAAIAKRVHARALTTTPVSNPGYTMAGEQRGNPTQNDSFFSTIIRLGFRLNDGSSPGSRARRQLRCPMYY